MVTNSIATPQSATVLESPKINAKGNTWDTVITTACVSVVAGVSIGLGVATKPIIQSVAIGAAAFGTGVGIAGLVCNYRHTGERNLLRSQNQQLQDAKTQQERQAEQLTVQLQEVQGKYNLLADAASVEQTRLQTELAMAKAATSNLPSIDVVDPTTSPLPATQSSEPDAWLEGQPAIEPTTSSREGIDSPTANSQT